MKFRLRWLSLLLVGVVGCGVSDPEPESPPKKEPEKKAEQAPRAKIELKPIKYEQLTDAVREHHGKVVVVDVWSTLCLPCMREFPHLVELHEKHAKDGLVALSLSLDQPKAASKALAFLNKVNARFSNYLIHEPPSVFQEKMGFVAIPAVFVFDREGKRVGKFTNDDPDKDPFTYEKDVIPLVKKLLAAK